MQYIYQILLPNEKSYIGFTNNLQQRHSVGKKGPTFKNYAESNPVMYKDMLVYGLDSVKVNILGTCQTIEEAEDLEFYWITKLDTINHLHGYNHVTSGHNKSHVVDPYYKSDEYKAELDRSITLIDRYTNLKVRVRRDRHINYQISRDKEKREQYKTTAKLKKQGKLSGYDTSHINIEEKKRKQLETSKAIDEETRRRFLETINEEVKI